MNDSADIVDPYARTRESSQPPPVGFFATLRHLGPGMILVGSIVGSGELIMTTKLGAETGFVLLWFVLLSCFIKVVVQAELARHTISSGRTYLDVFNSLPGPRGPRPVWLNLEWMAVVVLSSFLALAAYTWLTPANEGQAVQTTGQPATLGTQAAATSEGAAETANPQLAIVLNLSLLAFVVLVSVVWAWLIRFRSRRRVARGGTASPHDSSQMPVLNWFTWLWLATVVVMFVNGGAILGASGQALELALPLHSLFPNLLPEETSTYWGIIVAIVSALVLLSGGYKTLERISVGLVATFTVITIVCTFLLQWTGFAITPADVREGLTFDLPTTLTAGVVLTALGMYAGTGIGTSEMSSYTYWCVEKGYARNTGEREPGDRWPQRARGWVRVMYTDVLLTMVVYTVSTICFYFLGAAVLNARGLNPSGAETLSVLESIYTETLGDWAATLFVVGGFFVLFSTVLSGVAGGTRTLADGLCVMRIINPRDYAARLRFTRIFVVITLTLYSLTYALFEDPPAMLMISSMVAVVLYPVLGLGTLYLRYRDVDPRILPGKLTTFWLWVCALALAVISPAAALFALALKQGWIAI